MEISIRFATLSDTDALKNIWKACFGDEDWYIDFFFRHRFCAKNTVVASVCRQVVGVVHMLPATLGEKKFMYGYAVGVLPEFRGHDICKKMHCFIKEHAEKKQFIYGLHPANEKLFTYYRRIGLGDMFTLRTFDATSCENEGICSIENVTPAEYFRLREESFSPLVSWSRDMISYIFEESVQYGGFMKKIFVANKERILLGKKYQDILHVKETTMTDYEILQVSKHIKEFFGANQIIYTLPNTSTLGKEETMVLGFGEKNKDIYMNLFLD